jgi:hydrogenase nickel incorporation protein HypA/HybF
VHELSIALSLIDGAQEELARQGGGRVYALHLKLGPLAGVVKEALLFSYGIACEGTFLEGSSLVVEEVPILIYCAKCTEECVPVSAQCLQCARCGAPASDVIQGAELQLAALELEI